MKAPRNQTAIVTGGAKRIGAAITRALAADGWQILIHCNTSRAEAEALAAEVKTATVIQADLADPDIGNLILAAAKGLPPLGLLVNSASRFHYDRLEDFTAADFDTHMAVNLRAPALITRAFAQAIPEGTTALVINMLDAKLEWLNPDYLTYTLSKIGLHGLTELTARTYAPRLRCVGIAPAVTLVSGPQSRENFEAVHALNPLGQGVTIDDIIQALRFIIATPTYNAQTIVLDGGQRLMGLSRDVAYMVKTHD
jgi:NAD(P)-dependent dehydrogenase (short-subunit alcohol dehydrogenase family)